MLCRETTTLGWAGLSSFRNSSLGLVYLDERLLTYRRHSAKAAQQQLWTGHSDLSNELTRRRSQVLKDLVRAKAQVQDNVSSVGIL